MIQPAKARTASTGVVTAGVWFALTGSFTLPFLTSLMSEGAPGEYAPALSVVSIVFLVAGSLGTIVAAWVVAREAHASRLLTVVVATVCLVGWWAFSLALLTLPHWGTAYSLAHCLYDCGPSAGQIRTALVVVVTTLVVIATGIVIAARATSVTLRERVRVALLVVVASIPIANLLVFAATGAHNNPPSARVAPVG